MPLTIKRQDVKFFPDTKRVIARFFFPGGEERIELIISKILKLSKKEIHLYLNDVLRNFSERHRNITAIFKKHFDMIKNVLLELKIDLGAIPKETQLLIGSYFTMEYSIESAAFFNPSIIEDPDQSNLTEDGQTRIIVSFRATGEGHVSSIVFRSGIIDKNNELSFRPVKSIVDVPESIKRHRYNKNTFIEKFKEMNVYKDITKKEIDLVQKIVLKMITQIFSNLNETFIYGELQQSIENYSKKNELTYTEKRAIQAINFLASSHYEITFSLDTSISERVIFPVSYSETQGIEDARFVRFTDDDGSVIYYGTYTAYNGLHILPKLLETKDFYHFKILPINGEYAQNKGMALFPRKINGQYVMLSRCDGMSNYIMFSDNINLWVNSIKILEPQYPWELMQVGNCGSPIETEKGWLLITHGVGPMRRYCLGAALLDLNDPTKVIAHLKEPLLLPNEEEREGYVPNVVYSCGSVIHNSELIIAYAMSDTSSTFANVSLDELFSKM